MDSDSYSKKPPRLYEYKLPGDHLVLAGRSDEDNDYLSLKLARPDDWWFHVRGMPGSHVVLRVEPGEIPDRETLKKAAAIAAWHSKARSGGVVAVSGTLARFVTKARSSFLKSVRRCRARLSKQVPEDIISGCVSGNFTIRLVVAIYRGGLFMFGFSAIFQIFQ
jgi:hypothetical protein